MNIKFILVGDLNSDISQNDYISKVAQIDRLISHTDGRRYRNLDFIISNYDYKDLCVTAGPADHVLKMARFNSVYYDF
jgi:hypothetical protein